MLSDLSTVKRQPENRWKLYVQDIQHIGKKRRRKKQSEAISPGHLYDPELVCPGGGITMYCVFGLPVAWSTADDLGGQRVASNWLLGERDWLE